MAEDKPVTKKTTARKTAAPKTTATKKTTAKKATAETTRRTTATKKTTAKSTVSQTTRKTPMRKPPSTPVVPNAEARMAMIAEAAYYRAERRHFAPGYEREDWVAAEREIDEQLAHPKK